MYTEKENAERAKILADYIAMIKDRNENYAEMDMEFGGEFPILEEAEAA